MIYYKLLHGYKPVRIKKAEYESLAKDLGNIIVKSRQTHYLDSTKVPRTEMVIEYRFIEK